MPQSPSPSEGGGALSVDDAVDLLSPPDAEDASHTELTAEPTAEASPDEGWAEEAEREPEGPEEEPAPAIAAPHSWGAEEKALFAQLPAEVQQVVLARETQRDRAVFEAQQRAAESVRAVETELAGLADTSAAMDQVMASASRTFADRWQGVDWVRAASELSSEDYNRARAEYERDMGEMQRLGAAQQLAQEQAFAELIRAEEAKLPSLDPELCDPEKGMQRRGEVLSYLTGAWGYQPEFLNREMGAAELAIARKAMLYDRLQAKARQPAPRPTPAPARPALKPGAAPERSSQQRTLADAKARLSRTGSKEDAMAVLKAMRKAG